MRLGVGRLRPRRGHVLLVERVDVHEAVALPDVLRLVELRGVSAFLCLNSVLGRCAGVPGALVLELRLAAAPRALGALVLALRLAAARKGLGALAVELRLAAVRRVLGALVLKTP